MIKPWPLVFILFASGITLSHYQSWCGLLCAIVLILLGAAFIRLHYQVLLCFLVLLIGFLYHYWAGASLGVELPEVKNANITGVISDYPHCDGRSTSFFLYTDNADPYLKKIRVQCFFPNGFSRGDRVNIRGSMKPPAQPGNPGEFNYHNYLAYQKVYYIFSVKRPAHINLISPAHGTIKWINTLRCQGESIITQALPPQESAIVLGMLLGKREGIDPDQYNDFQKTGIVHLFSVSGLHVGFILLLTGCLTSSLGLSRRGRLYLSIFTLLFYGTMIAWPVSVQRAALMSSLGFLAYYSGRKNSLLNALAISGLVILLINPDSLFTVSFQLTMVATWGLVVIFPALRKYCSRLGWAGDLVLIPLAAELAVLPLIAYHFNLFTPVSLFSNILVTYLAGALVILGFIAFFLASCIPLFSTLLLAPVGLLAELILIVVSWSKSLPGSYFWVSTPRPIIIMIYYLSLLVLLAVMSGKLESKWAKAAGSSILLFFLLLFLPTASNHRGLLEVVFLDVGQGDSILLKTPRGRFILVDGGGSDFYDVGGRIVLPYLHHRGIHELYLLINTHPDKDHLQGLESVAREKRTKYIALPGTLADSSTYQNLRKIAAAKKIPLLALKAGQSLDLEEGIKVKVLNPDPKNIIKHKGYNDDSIVIEVRHQQIALLLTGDIEKQSLEKLLGGLAKGVKRVVKIPHHGSRGSLSLPFYQELAASYAVISVGENNPFGHPHPEVLETLGKENISVWRTDQHGAITMYSDGKTICVETFLN